MWCVCVDTSRQTEYWSYIQMDLFTHYVVFRYMNTCCVLNIQTRCVGTRYFNLKVWRVRKVEEEERWGDEMWYSKGGWHTGERENDSSTSRMKMFEKEKRMKNRETKWEGGERQKRKKLCHDEKNFHLYNKRNGMELIHEWQNIVIIQSWQTHTTTTGEKMNTTQSTRYVDGRKEKLSASVYEKYKFCYSSSSTLEDPFFPSSLSVSCNSLFM